MACKASTVPASPREYVFEIFSASIMGSLRLTGLSYFWAARRSQQNFFTGGNPSLDFHHAFLFGSDDHRPAVRATHTWDVDETLLAIAVYSRRRNQQRLVLGRLNRDVGRHVGLKKLRIFSDIDGHLVIHDAGDDGCLGRDALDYARKIARGV